MSDSPNKNPEWRDFYQESLTREILRSERRRVTILAGLFVLLACVYSIFAFVPGLLDSDLNFRLRARWPSMISLYGVIIAYEWTLRGIIDRLISRARTP
jgi:hypothetical protein